MDEPEESLLLDPEGAHYHRLRELGERFRELEHRKNEAEIAVQVSAELTRLRTRAYLISYFGFALILANTVVAVLIGQALLDNVLMVCLLLFSFLIGLGFLVHAQTLMGLRRRTIVQHESKSEVRELEYMQDRTAQEIRHLEALSVREQRLASPPSKPSPRWEAGIQ